MSAIDRAEKAIAANPRTEELNLENFGLDTLAPLLPSLGQLSRLRKLKLGKNNLTGLPEDLSALRAVEYLDISGNPVSGLNSVIRGLFCLTALKHLYVDLPFETDEDEIIVSLHSLESFNGTPLTENFDEEAQSGGPAQNQATAVPSKQAWAAPSQSSPSKGGSGTQSSLGAKTKWEESDLAQVQRLYQAANSVSGRVVNKAEFDEYSRNVVSHLHTLLTGEEDPFKREAEILRAKKILFEYCFEEVARSSHRFDANLSQVLSILQDTYGGLLDHYEKLFKSVAEDKDRKLDVMKTDMQHAIQEIEQLMAQLDGKGGGGNDAASRAQFENERRKLTEEIGWLRTENEKLQTKLRQSELGRPSAGASRSMISQGGASPARTSGAPAVGNKVLTLRQLRDTIDDIYASKSKYDIKCAETHLPRETMEQHMYTYLNQKYGLKHLILEWATAIIQGVKKHSSDDNDVAVFGKILRNEIDEEFRFVQRQLKETVHELLRVYVKGKMPLKGDEEINQMVKRKVAGTLIEDEWLDIVKYMYNSEDSVSIIMRIREVLKQRAAPRRRVAPQTRRGQQQKDEDPLLTYAEFIRILLDFQLEGHERFLSRFVRIFKQYDTDRNGIVNEHEFRMVLRAVDPTKSEEEVTALLDLIDPHNNQLINFSECVTFLSSELVKMMKEENQ